MLTPKQLQIAKQIIESPDDDFMKLVSIAGLRPGIDFRYSNLDKVRFGTADLSTFDFTGASTVGANISQTTGIPVVQASIDPLAEQDIFLENLRASIQDGKFVGHAQLSLRC